MCVACVWGIQTNHPSLERLPLWSRQHSNRGSSACLQEEVAAFGCAVMVARPSDGDRPNRASSVSARSFTAEPCLRFSILLDLALDSELARLPQANFRGIFTSYVKLREQVSAIHQVITAELVLFADFSLFGPHGKRLLRKFTHLHCTFMPDGSWQRKELLGPPSFETASLGLSFTQLTCGCVPSSSSGYAAVAASGRTSNYDPLSRG